MAIDPYFIDFPQRVKAVQAAMAEHGIDVYLGSRLRTLSWIAGAFCPWRSFIVVPPEGLPTVYTFVIDASRVADDSWLDTDHVLGYAPMGGQDQVSAISDMVKQDILRWYRISESRIDVIYNGIDIERFLIVLFGVPVVAHQIVDHARGIVGHLVLRIGIDRTLELNERLFVILALQVRESPSIVSFSHLGLVRRRAGRRAAGKRQNKDSC